MLFKTSLRLELKKAVDSKAFLLILVAMFLVLTGVYLGDKKEEDSIGIRIGIIIHGNNEHLEAIANNISSLSLSGIEFTRLFGKSLQEIKDSVATEEYLGIYILNDELIKAVIEGRPKRAMDLYSSPNFFIDKIITAWIYSVVMTELSAESSADVISNIMKIPRENLVADVENIYNNYAENHTFVNIKSSYYGGEGDVEQLATQLIDRRIYHGIIALGLLLLNWAMLPQGISLYNKTHSRLNQKQRRQITISAMVANIIVNFIVGILGIAFVFIFSHQATGDILVELVALAVYCISMVSIFNIIAGLNKDDSLLFSAGIFTFLVFLALGGVLIDTGELGEILGGIGRLIPSHYYQQATVYNDLFGIIPLGLAAVVLAIISVIIGQRERALG